MAMKDQSQPTSAQEISRLQSEDLSAETSSLCTHSEFPDALVLGLSSQKSQMSISPRKRVETFRQWYMGKKKKINRVVAVQL